MIGPRSSSSASSSSFFVGLFIVVAGVEHAGLLRLFADRLTAWTGGDLAATALVVLGDAKELFAIGQSVRFYDRR